MTDRLFRLTVTHMACDEVPEEFFVRYLPHNMVLGSDGLVLKNYEDIEWDDVEACATVLPAAKGAEGGEDKK